jgi:hypothetical protein
MVQVAVVLMAELKQRVKRIIRVVGAAWAMVASVLAVEEMDRHTERQMAPCLRHLLLLRRVITTPVEVEVVVFTLQEMVDRVS